MSKTLFVKDQCIDKKYCGGKKELNQQIQNIIQEFKP